LFTINPKNVKAEAKELVIKYKLECYNALFSHFEMQSKFLEEKQTAIISLQEEIEQDRLRLDEVKESVKLKKHKLDKLKELTLQDYKENNRQLSLF